MAVASLPLIIKDSLGFISAYLLSPAVMFGRSGISPRAMRSDRRGNLQKVLAVLIRGCCLQHDGIICHITRFWVRPLSISEIAKYVGICTRTVARCLADLVDLGLIECYQIKRKNPITGQFEVSIGIRKFTDKFWTAIGQLEKYREAEKWAKKNGKRKFLCPFKQIGESIKQAAQSANTLAKKAIKGLETDAMKIRKNCNAILTMLRQKK